MGRFFFLIAISLILAMVPASGLAQPLRAAAPEAGLPLLFVENAGQFSAAGDGETVRFVVQGEAFTLRLTDQALWFTYLTPPEPATGGAQAGDAASWPGLNLRLAFVDANPRPRLEPFNRLETRVSYFRGSDSTAWQTGVPVWGGVRYIDLYPGFDLELTGENGRLELRWVVKPEAAGQSSDSSPLGGVRFQGVRDEAPGPGRHEAGKIRGTGPPRRENAVMGAIRAPATGFEGTGRPGKGEA